MPATGFRMRSVPRVLVFLFFLTFAPLLRADDLPCYDLKIFFDTLQHRVDIEQTITWTNRAKTPTQELNLNFYPHYRIPKGDYLLLAKTLELLRLNPRDGIDREGRAGVITAIRHGGQPIEFFYQHDNPTAFTIKLPKPVGPGESVTVEVDATIILPNKQGRWGHWDGIHYLTNALPVVAYYDDRGWHAMPFVPWHQPFWNEAGHYTASITLPIDETIACSAVVKSTHDNGDGTKTIITEPFLGRDFAFLCSKLYKETCKEIVLKSGKQITLKCLAYEKHQYYAETLLQYVAEAIPIYSDWFGDYPYGQFTIAESFFGWNGNECAGLILIDERVFGSPQLGRGYAEYLVSHETCHQWWYNLVGTNGYSETFIDEGAATYFTHRMLDRKVGKKNNFMHWRENLDWLPNIQRPNYRYASLYAAIGKDQLPAAAGDLPSFGHLIGLFNGAYDRGSKALGMMEARMGEDAFMDFIKDLVEKYSFRVLQASDYQRELEEYTGQSWQEFYDHWVFGKGLTDWSIESVKVDNSRTALMPGMLLPVRTGFRRIELELRHRGETFQGIVIGIDPNENGTCDIRIPIDPAKPVIQQVEGQISNLVITPGADGVLRVSFDMHYEPSQIVLDPDAVLLDPKPGNNRWHNKPRVYVSPLYTMLNETDLTNDYDRWNFGAGPWIGGALYPDPWFVRSTMIGARAGAYRTQIFNGGLYAAYRTDYRDLVIGADGLLDHQPFAKSQIGFNVERRVGGPYGDVNGSDTATRAAAFARYVFQYGASLYLPPMHYVELFSTYQDNFLPFARATTPGSVRPDWTQFTGIHHRLNLYTPYWDPECGVWTDFVYGAGVADLNVRETHHQLRGELAAVKKFPDWCCLGRLSDTRLAVRAVAMGAFPDEGQFFALGGGTLFRGYDLAERQGSFLWVGNVELRLPLARNVQWDALDSTLGVRNVWFATFYDVGAVYGNGQRVGGVAHALGGGIRVDTAIFSFIERATLRFDFGKTINDNTPFQFWFGVQHAF